MSGRRQDSPIHQAIRAYLDGLLATGKLRPGMQVPSDRQLMARFKTSNMPVRRAMQHFINAGVFQRIHGSGTFVQGKDGRRLGTIAVICPHDHAGMWNSHFYTTILHGIQDVMVDADQRLLLESCADEPYAAMCKLEDRADGFLVLDLYPSLLAQVEKYAREKRKPLVMINYPHATPLFDCVLTDNTGNAQALVQHLIGHGHLRIACIFSTSPARVGREPHPSVELRLMGYRQAMQRAGLRIDERLLVDWPRDDTDRTIRRLLDQGATACFCLSHQLAVRTLLPALNRLGRSVPKDLSVVAYDNTSDTAEAQPALTVIDTSLSQLGQTAAQRLLEIIPQAAPTRSTIVLHGAVLERASVRTLPG